MRWNGFTLVELLVALVLLNVGLLGLVGTSAALVRLAGDSASRSAAVAAVSSSRERLWTRGCATIQPGSTAVRGGAVRWSVTPPDAAGVRHLLVVGTRTTPQGPRADSLDTRCVG